MLPNDAKIISVDAQTWSNHRDIWVDRVPAITRMQLPHIEDAGRTTRRCGCGKGAGTQWP